MIAIVNDVSFQYSYETADMAVSSVHQFLDICKRMKRDEITSIDEIKMGVIDTQIEIAPDYKLIQLIQEFEDREERRFLLSILTNQGTYKTEAGKECIIDGKASLMCSHGIGNFLISLLSSTIFAKEKVEGTIEDNKVELRNLAKNEHIDFYRRELGIRRYVANDKKHKFDRENNYGKGKVGSRMDLRDEEAQDLLNRAIYIKGRLYAKKSGSYYAFQNEQDVIYHGYRADDLGDNVKGQLDKVFG